MILQSLYEKQNQIRALRKEIKTLETDLECELANALMNKITQEGDYMLQTTFRNQNTINAQTFNAAYPEIFKKIAHIQKKDAVRELKHGGHNTMYIEEFLGRISDVKKIPEYTVINTKTGE